MNKATKCALFALVIVGIIVAIAVILIVTLTGKRNGTETNDRVMYYAMYLGDWPPMARRAFMPSSDHQNHCSLELNLDHTRDSILAMHDLEQRYSFILFTDHIVETTAPVDKNKAILKLGEIGPEARGPDDFNQKLVMKKFIEERRNEDLLVYYIPCKFSYSKDDNDLKDFVNEMNKADVSKRTLIVSNTQSEQILRELYVMESENVVGYDSKDIPRRISEFGHIMYNFTTLTPPFFTDLPPKVTDVPVEHTTGNGTTSTPTPKTKLVPTTTVTSTREQKPTTSTKVTKNIPTSTTTIPLLTESTDTPTVPERETTTSPTQKPESETTTTMKVTEEPLSSTTYAASTETTAKPFPPSTAPPPKENIHCLMVGDLYNYDANRTAYEKEVSLMNEINVGLFEAEGFSSLGLWIYGHTELFTSLDEALTYMRTSPIEFMADLQEISYSPVDQPLSTAGAIENLNNLTDDKDRVNCLIFFSAQEKTANLPPLDPDHNKSRINRIVAVGLSDTNLHRVVVPPRGIAVQVPYSYTPKNVDEVVAAVMGRIEHNSTTTVPIKSTTILERKTSTVTTDGPATTVTRESPIPRGIRCLFVYDLYNFGNDEEAYDKENAFVADIGEGFFTTTTNSAAGLWAYGHTSIDKTPDDALNEMHSIFHYFNVGLAELDYDDTNGDPLSTEQAIERINETKDNNKRANCLVFFSAQQNTSDLPQLSPPYMSLDRIVAVGLNNTDLTRIIPQQGVAISVRYNYENKDVKAVVDAILGGKHTEKPESSTTTVPTTKESATTKNADVTDTEAPVTTTSPEVITEKPTTTLSVASTETTAPPLNKSLHCLLVGDLYNYGANETAYMNEVDFIADVSYDLFKAERFASLGLWLYGHTELFSSLEKSLNNMKTSIDDFLEDLWEIKYAAVEKHLSTAEAIEELNNLVDERNRVNCLIFLSAQENTTDLPPLDLERSNSSINRIVAVGLSETNLTKIVAPPRGVALSVSYNYTQNNVAEVVDAVLGREPSSTTPEIPTTKVSASTETSKVTTSEVPTTAQDPKVTTSELPVSKTSPEVNTESLETTSSIASTESPVPMKSNVHCLFAGDLLNFDRNTTAYEREKELITNIGKKLFETTANATGVVWAYGYTTGPAGLKTTFTAMKDNFVDFKNDVDTKMKYEAIEKPNLNNAGAINNLNDASDRNKNANCLVFFSGLTKAKGVSKLDPGKKGNNEFKKVVVVSLSGTDLRTIIDPPRGAAVTVSRKFSEEDVRNVMEKILDANY